MASQRQAQKVEPLPPRRNKNRLPRQATLGYERQGAGDEFRVGRVEKRFVSETVVQRRLGVRTACPGHPLEMWPTWPMAF